MCPPWSHCTFAVLLAVVVVSPAMAQAPDQTVTFRIFVRGADVGSEQVSLEKAPDGWTIRGSGRLGSPIDLDIRKWEVRYDPAWMPKELTLDLAARSEARLVHTTISGTSALSEIGGGSQPSRKTDTVAADTIVLPNLVFGAYEALAARLSTSAPGAELRAFIAPQGEIAIRVSRVSDEKIQTPARAVTARRWQLTFMNPGAPLDLEVWTEAGRLLRVDIPAQMVSVLREDIASVAARLVTTARPNDEQISIPANGFSLAATISRPSGTTDPRLPAVILVSGSGLADRDEVIAGVPVFGQLASALADAGFMVLRYDRRGVGQSGGRHEAATLADFADDARAVVTYVSKRKDVDLKRVALLGYGDGGWLGLQVASRGDRVAALVLVAAASVSGADLVLEQQRHALDRSTMPAADQQQAIERQKKIIQAVISGTGWEEVSPDIRRRVDTPWYQSFLTFDPSRVLSRTRQPILVVHGELDREVAPYHSEQLAQLARARPKGRGTQLVRLPGLNHLLVRATTGEVDEYNQLPERSVSPQALLEISSWLRRALLPPERGR